MEYSIGEVAKMSGLNISTLRYYDKEGLFPTMARSKGGIRVFSEVELGAIRIIECLKATGLPIKDIKQYMEWYKQGDTTLEQRKNLYYDRLTVVQKQLEEVQATMAIIQYKCWFYEKALEFGSEEAVYALGADELPDEFRKTLQLLEYPAVRRGKV